MAYETRKKSTAALNKLGKAMLKKKKKIKKKVKKKMTMKDHEKHHTKTHINLMKKLMKQGKTIEKAHIIAMKEVGK